ncbi:MAG: glycoside hydrolase family 88 protein [Paludibacteraceae bacterium]|nr:glycoside hydrolase family 88 protein [Paludibacteraceae bacterium]
MKTPTILLAAMLILATTQTVKAQNPNVDYTSAAVIESDTALYSRLIINSCLYHFKANTTAAGFAKYDANGNEISNSESGRGFDYVPGLVAKAVLECVDYYQDQEWVKPWFYSMQAYAEKYYNENHTGGSLDDLNACKLYFGLADLTKTGAAFADATVAAHCETAKTKALAGLKDHNEKYAISSSVSHSFTDDDTDETYTGGWWHKNDYENQLWLDGQYMGPALLAMMNAEDKNISGSVADDWVIIMKQFNMCWNRLWDSEKKLLYHAFSATPSSDQTKIWADQTGTYATNSHYGVSPEFWGRSVGWYFFALVDILEQMDKAGKHDADYTELKRQLEAVADGLLDRQDPTTGCWCQLLQYGNGVKPAGCSTDNYIESSATAIFVSTLLKGMRLGYLDRAKYEEAAKKGYHGFLKQFLRKSIGDGNAYGLIHNCRSAGLSNADKDSEDRDGSAAYYLAEKGKKDTQQSNEYTEGKVLGAFILAATEYERAYVDTKCNCLKLTLE